MQKRISAKISGRVQGVGFRYFTREIAREMGIVGYVRNTSDEGVEVVAEGEEGLLSRFIGLLRQGPPRAEVTDVEISRSEPTGEYDAFYVKR